MNYLNLPVDATPSKVNNVLKAEPTYKGNIVEAFNIYFLVRTLEETDDKTLTASSDIIHKETFSEGKKLAKQEDALRFFADNCR